MSEIERCIKNMDIPNTDGDNENYHAEYYLRTAKASYSNSTEHPLISFKENNNYKTDFNRLKTALSAKGYWYYIACKFGNPLLAEFNATDKSIEDKIGDYVYSINFTKNNIRISIEYNVSDCLDSYFMLESEYNKIPVVSSWISCILDSLVQIGVLSRG